eukprot:6154497-Karenia_brevis.AAC.1
MKEACSVEKGWWIGAVTKQKFNDKVPKGVRQKINRFESLNEEDDEHEDEDEEIPPLEEPDDEG